jgi:hypothetical protein
MIFVIKIGTGGLELFGVLADGLLVGERGLEVGLFGGLLIEFFAKFFHGLIFRLELIVVVDKFRVLKVVVDVILLMRGLICMIVWMKIRRQISLLRGMFLRAFEFDIVLRYLGIPGWIKVCAITIQLGRLISIRPGGMYAIEMCRTINNLLWLSFVNLHNLIAIHSM